MAAPDTPDTPDAPDTSRSKTTAGLYKGSADITGGANAGNDSKTMFAFGAEYETNPSGAKGIGEPANVGTAAAVANAVFHATGQRIRELPITINKLIGAARS